MIRTRGHSATPSSKPADRRPAAGLVVGLIALLWLAGGCGPDPDCTEIGCPAGERCEASTGECLPRTNDCTSTGCPAGEVCDDQSGLCRRLSCPDEPCPDGQACNTEDGKGFCEPIPDCATDGCTSPAETCDAASGECIAKGCQVDNDCPGGYICAESNVCRSGCRIDRPDCPPQTFCRPVSGQTAGQCLPECTTSRECPHGQYCPTRTGESTCQPEPPCEKDRECRTDEICRSDECVAPPCSSDEDCTGERTCDRATGLCIGGRCDEDRLGPNQTSEEAAELKFDRYNNLHLCQGRSDWFALEVDSSQALTFRLEHPADRDVDLVVYDSADRQIGADQQRPPKSAFSSQFASSVTVFSQRAQTIRLRIYTTERESPDEETPALPVEVTYDLEVRRADDQFCADDDYEENDRRRAASRLPSNVGDSPVYKDFQICGGDVDWYRLPDIPAEAGLRARLIDSPNHLELGVLSEDGGQFSLTPGEQFDLLRTGTRGDWYLRVASTSQESGSYGLTYGVPPAWDCPEKGQHAGIDQAVAPTTGALETYALCPQDDKWEVDWIALEPPTEEGLLSVDIDPESALPDLVVELYEQKPSGLNLLRRAAPNDDGSYGLARQATPNQSFLLRISASQPVGRLHDKTTYEVTYQYDQWARGSIRQKNARPRHSCRGRAATGERRGTVRSRRPQPHR